MRRLMIELDASTVERLRGEARRQRRTMQGQAAIMLAIALGTHATDGELPHEPALPPANDGPMVLTCAQVPV